MQRLEAPLAVSNADETDSTRRLPVRVALFVIVLLSSAFWVAAIEFFKLAL